jgi:hypothetical protein
MKNESRFVWSSLGILLLVALLAAAWPMPATTAPTSHQDQASPQTQSVSGKVASVEKNSFSLTVGSAISNGEHLAQTAPKTLNFVIDQNTTLDGKLQVGASADVTYREDSGKNIAISVRISS